MAEIKSFKALMYTEKAGEIQTNVCPPYDIINAKQRTELCEKSPYNLINLELPEGSDKYNTAGELLKKWISEGVLARETEDAMFLYQEEFEVDGKGYSFDGLICLCKTYDFSEKIVLPHEETLSKAKEDRFNLMKTTFCNFSSIYSLYNDENRTVSSLLNPVKNDNPIRQFTDEEGVTHRLWRITCQKTLQNIIDFFAPKQLYIADGHHRYETAGRFNKYVTENGIKNADSGYVLMTLVDMEDDGLVVFPTHRLVVDMAVDADDLVKKAEKNFKAQFIEGTDSIKATLSQSSAKHSYGLYTGGSGWWLLTANDVEICEENRSEAYKKLDITVLHNLILEEILGIDKENMANQTNLRYTRDISEALDSVNNGTAGAAFIMNPTKISELRDVSLAGDKMPQKSTYFYPKLVTGLVINKISGDE